MSRHKELILIVILVLIGVPYCVDFAHELFEDSHDIWYLWMEGVASLLVIAGITFLAVEIRQRSRDVSALTLQLSKTRADLMNARTDIDELKHKIQQSSRQYGDIIQEQLSAWGLSVGEKEVALLLLKGLSFEEVANVRGTRDKTVRQQATAIYRKSGLNGRHEFAAWFFEDLL